MRELFVSRFCGRTWAAVREEGSVVELHAEAIDSARSVGAVVKARVLKVLPGIQSAFVDIGQEKDAFLHVRDLMLPEEGPGETGAEEAGELDLLDGDDDEGTNGELDTGVPAGAAWRRRVIRQAPIQDRLKEGRDILVQVVRDAIRSKGPRVSSYLTLPGRYLVYLPNLTMRGISRKIEDPEERERLRSIVRDLPGKGGFIVRTAGEGGRNTAFVADAEMLIATWKEISEKAGRLKAPAMAYRDLDVLRRQLRDAPREGYDLIMVDDETAYDRAVDYLRDLDPVMAANVRIHSGDTPLFHEYGIDQEIEKALRPRAWLKSGGYLIIEPTEALVSIDVNTGRYIGRDDMEQTVLRTNIEAATEIARQLRLRDLGGIIVIDFIDMGKDRSRREVLDTLTSALRRDRSRTKVVGIGELGLVELTRKRTRPALGSLLMRQCPWCSGTGRLKGPEWTGAEAIQEILRLLSTLEGKDVVVRAHPETVQAVTAGLQSHGLPDECRDPGRLKIEEDSSMRPDTFDVVAR